MMNQQYPYFAPVDGLRALAVIFVLLYHLGIPFFSGGFLGVDIFFVLSGYWITYVLLQEYKQNSRVHLSTFFYKRFRRLIPAMLLTICLITLILAVIDAESLGRHRENAIISLLFLNNWQQVFIGENYLANIDPSPFRHFWSLAVEGQFYILWGCIFFFYIRTRQVIDFSNLAIKFLFVAGLFYLLQWSWLPDVHQTIVSCKQTPNAYILLGANSNICISRLELAYLGTFGKLLPLSLGSALALLLRSNPPLSEAPLAHHFMQRVARWLKTAFHNLLGWSALLVILYLSISMHTYTSTANGNVVYLPLFTWGIPILSLATVALIYVFVHTKTTLLSFIFSLPLFVWLGRRSYGIYLLHWPIFLLFKDASNLYLTWTEGLLAISLTVFLANIIYQYVENPIRRLGFLRYFLGSRWQGFKTKQSHKSWSLMIARILLLFVPLFLTTYTYIEANNTPSPLLQQLTKNQDVVIDLKKINSLQLPASLLSNNSWLELPSREIVDQPQPTQSKQQTAPEYLEYIEPKKTPDTNQESLQQSQVEPSPVTDAKIHSSGRKSDLSTLAIFGIGDSVMLGSAIQLQERGIPVDAKISRQAPEILEIIEQLNQQQTKIDGLVIHIGTNGNIQPETLYKFLLATAEIPYVIILTVAGNRTWIESNNQIIRTLAEDWPNVEVLDWQKLVQNCSDCLLKDGIHLSKTGQKIYSKQISSQFIEFYFPLTPSDY